MTSVVYRPDEPSSCPVSLNVREEGTIGKS